MKTTKFALTTALLIVVGFSTSVVWGQTARWPEHKASAWYAQQPWLIGSDYIPQSAINQLGESDIITFHNYSWPEYFKREVAWLKKYNRPVICAEFMARSMSGTYDTVLPIAQEERIGAINWGLVAGKTQTYLPGDSWQHPYILSQPPVWFHEALRADGTPYRQTEVDLIPQLVGKPEVQR